MTDWKETQLIDACSKIGSGATPRGGNSVYLESGEYSLIRSQNVYNDGFSKDGLAYISSEQAKELSNVEVEAEDILLNITGDSVARCCQVPEEILPARVNQHVSIIRPDKLKLWPQYLRYFLISPQMQDYMLGMAHAGATRKALTKGMIESFKVPCPDINIQKNIASILGSLDDKIELNRKQNETLEAMAKALFQSWFVDFDPVIDNVLEAKKPIPAELAEKAARRKAAKGRFPALPNEIKKLFSSEFEPSPLGPIPKGWEVSTVEDEFNITMGQSPPGTSYNETGQGVQFYQGRSDFGFRFPRARIYCTEPKRFAKKSDTLMSVRAPVGDINMAGTDCCIGRGLAALRHKSNSRSYTYYMVHDMGDVFRSFEANGTVFGCIGKNDFNTVKCVKPFDAVVKAFEGYLYPMDEKIEIIGNETSTLAQLRDALLPKLLSGEIVI